MTYAQAELERKEEELAKAEQARAELAAESEATSSARAFLALHPGATPEEYAEYLRVRGAQAAPKKGWAIFLAAGLAGFAAGLEQSPSWAEQREDYYGPSGALSYLNNRILEAGFNGRGEDVLALSSARRAIQNGQNPNSFYLRNELSKAIAEGRPGEAWELRKILNR